MPVTRPEFVQHCLYLMGNTVVSPFSHPLSTPPVLCWFALGQLHLTLGKVSKADKSRRALLSHSVPLRAWSINSAPGVSSFHRTNTFYALFASFGHCPLLHRRRVCAVTPGPVVSTREPRTHHTVAEFGAGGALNVLAHPHLYYRIDG